MTKNKLIIGSRESRLAVLQSEMVQDFLNKNHPELETEILTMKTTGDKILDRTLDKIGGKGLFVKELDLALLDRRSDISVHSLKDMPMEVPEELPLLAFSKREDPRDVLVLPKGVSELDKNKPLGCSSLRRTLQLASLYPDMEVKSIRGNLQTRLRKLDEGEYSGLDPCSGRIETSWSGTEDQPLFYCRGDSSGSRTGDLSSSGTQGRRLFLS